MVTGDSRYDKSFYEANVHDSRRSGELVLSHVLNLLPGTTSVADVGCGTGAWLSVLREKGIDVVQGYDGEWVLAAEALTIPRDCFQPVDLNKSWEITRRFDLAVSVEVGEHLQPDKSAGFVHMLTKLSDVVLFSAAIPGQGGTDHINEQWPSFWVALFEKNGYKVVDAVRGLIWEDSRICHWYRQNLLLFVNQAAKADLIDTLERQVRPPLRVIHPDLYLYKNMFFLPNIMDANISVGDAFRLFMLRARKAIERRLPQSKG